MPNAARLVPWRAKKESSSGQGRNLSLESPGTPAVGVVVATFPHTYLVFSSIALIFTYTIVATPQSAWHHSGSLP